MRRIDLWVGGAMLLAAGPAHAADALKFGSVPSWVIPQTVPAASDTSKDRPIAILLHDQQALLETGKISTYAELAFKIQQPEGLAAGNLSIAWDPATDTVTVNRLEIHRGDQVIDVLKSGQTFTTMRRETSLDLATLDGVLTANIQPEGLQEGDVVIMATTTEHSDPVLKGHVEAIFAPWGASQIGLAHSRLSWPSKLNVNIHRIGDLPVPQQVTRDGKTVYELTMRNVEPVIAPKSAPLRFRLGRMGEATDFRSWAEAAKLMVPLYRDASVIPASGPLRDEVEKIRKGSADPKSRAEQAVQLVQQRVRYVALVMGQGGYVPAPAGTTWSRRFGDCKAKTALLLGILKELGIDAEPVAVNPILGDAIADRLPMIGLFNHVLVRAHVGGKDYWLDGTRTGDNSLDGIQVPNFGWGLPLIDKAALVRIVPPPLTIADNERTIDVDATAGIYAPAKVGIDELLRGDGAVAFNTGYSRLSADQRTEFLRARAKYFFDSITVESSSVQFDKTTNELRISTKGTAKLDWEDDWFRVPSASIAYTPDFDRPAGASQEVPFATDYPNYEVRHVTIRLPQGFLATQTKPPLAVHETLAGVEYGRVIGLTGDTMTVDSSERTIAPEVPYKTALAAAARLKVLDNDDVYLRVPNGYRASAEDLAAKTAEKPASVQDFIDRGLMLLDVGRIDEAIADFDDAVRLDPKNIWAVGDRGIARVWKRDFDGAAKDLASVEAVDPKNSVLLRAKALQAELQGKYGEASDFYTQSLKSEPDNAFALGHRAMMHHALNENDQALVDSEQALARNPAWVDLRLMRATILLIGGKKSDAATEAATLMADGPKSSERFVGAARIYARLGMHKEAMAAFDRAIAIKPEAYIYINRAQSRPFTDYSGRIADLDEAIKLDEKNSIALAEKAEQLAVMGDFKSALGLYDRVIAISSDNREFVIRRAIMLHKAGRTAEAEKIFATERGKAKTSSDFNSLCWIAATAGVRMDQALKDCEEAVRLDPTNSAALDSLAFVELRDGKTDEAIALYDRALAKRPQSASYMGRAIAYGRKGDKARAESDRAQALLLDPDAETRFSEYGLKP